MSPKLVPTLFDELPPVTRSLGGLRQRNPTVGYVVLAGSGRTERDHEYVHGLAFSPDGSRLVSASGDNTVRIWEGGAPEDVSPKTLYLDPVQE